MVMLVVLDPDGTHDLGSMLIVESQTSIIYEHQCGGTRNEIRRTEGYLVDVGPSWSCKRLCEWFRKSHPGGLFDATDDELFREKLSAIVSDIKVWVEAEGARFDVVPHSLELDESRLDELIEAWIPVTCPLGSAILIHKNRD
jgi:hypothetical protein